MGTGTAQSMEADRQPTGTAQSMEADRQSTGTAQSMEADRQSTGTILILGRHTFALVVPENGMLSSVKVSIVVHSSTFRCVQKGAVPPETNNLNQKRRWRRREFTPLHVRIV